MDDLTANMPKSYSAQAQEVDPKHATAIPSLYGEHQRELDSTGIEKG